MSKKDPELKELEARFQKGGLYCFDAETNTFALWHENGKNTRDHLKTGRIIMFLRLERAIIDPILFRVWMIAGENIAYVILNQYQVISYFKPVDTELVLG